MFIYLCLFVCLFVCIPSCQFSLNRFLMQYICMYLFNFCYVRLFDLIFLISAMSVFLTFSLCMCVCVGVGVWVWMFVLVFIYLFVLYPAVGYGKLHITATMQYYDDYFHLCACIDCLCAHVGSKLFETFFLFLFISLHPSFVPSVLFRQLNLLFCFALLQKFTHISYIWTDCRGFIRCLGEFHLAGRASRFENVNRQWRRYWRVDVQLNLMLEWYQIWTIVKSVPTYKKPNWRVYVQKSNRILNKPMEYRPIKLVQSVHDQTFLPQQCYQYYFEQKLWGWGWEWYRQQFYSHRYYQSYQMLLGSNKEICVECIWRKRFSNKTGSSTWFLFTIMTSTFLYMNLFFIYFFLLFVPSQHKSK